MEIWRKTLEVLGLDAEDLAEPETLAAPERPDRHVPRAANHAPRDPAEMHGGSGRHRRGAVRRMPGVRPYWSVHVTEPGAYVDAKEIGDQLVAGTSVVMNLENAEEDLLRRMVAFASGLAYGLEGGIRTVAPHLYLVTPRGVAVTGQAPRRRRRRPA